MRTYSSSSRNALLLLVAWMFFNGYTACQAMSSDMQSARAAAAGGSNLVQPVQSAARLVVRRAPNLGANVAVRLWVDGAQVGTIGYGHTYQGSLAPGRHILSVLPSPRSQSRTPWQMTLDVQNGQTYNFTATGDSGYLILKGGLAAPRVL
jgi:hypothetical protein